MFVMMSWFYFAGCNKPKIDQGSGDNQLAYHTGQLVSFLFNEVCKHPTSIGLLNSYESDECSAEEPVETLSEECLLGTTVVMTVHLRIFHFNNHQIPREHHVH